MASIGARDLLGVFNVREYGASGDGVANDAPAIQAAIKAADLAGGGRVVLPAGTYLVKTTITLPCKLTLEGAGRATTIKLAPGVNANVLQNENPACGDDFLRLLDLRIDGNRANNTSGTWYGLYLNQVTDAWIERVQITGVRTHGVLLASCVRVHLQGVWVSDCGTHGIALTDSSRCQLVACRSVDNGKIASAGTGDGVNLAGASLDNVIADLVAYDTSVGSKLQGYGVREDAASACDRTLILGGSLSGNLTGPTSTVGASSKVVDNAAPVATSGTPSTQAFGDAAARGTGTTAAPLDHKHAMPANPVATSGTPSTQAPGDAAARGTGTTAAPLDHVHGMPQFAVRIAETVLATSAASIDFTAIPQTYRHLLLLVYARTDAAVTQANLRARFNGDTAANYDWQSQGQKATTQTGAEQLGETSTAIGTIPGASAAANLFGGAEARILHYRGATNQKLLVAQYTFKIGTSTTQVESGEVGGHWRSSAAINQITLFPASGNFVADTVATLYGIP